MSNNGSSCVVYFGDGSWTSVLVGPDTTVQQLCTAVMLERKNLMQMHPRRHPSQGDQSSSFVSSSYSGGSFGGRSMSSADLQSDEWFFSMYVVRGPENHSQHGNSSQGGGSFDPTLPSLRKRCLDPVNICISICVRISISWHSDLLCSIRQAE